MTTRTLFNIILKVIGLMFIRLIVMSLVSVVGTAFFWNSGPPGAAQEFFGTVIMLGIYVLVAYLFIFRSDSIVDRMKLHEDLGVDIIPINMHRSTILSIALIIIGGLMLVDEIPNLARQLYIYYRRSQLELAETDMSYLVFSVFKIIVGLLIIGNQRKLVSLIELNSRYGK